MKRAVAVLLLLAVVLGTLVGCGKNAESGDTSVPSETVGAGAFSKDDITFITADGESVYRIVRPDGDKELTATASLLYKQMKSKLDVQVINTSDFDDGTDMYEILIGNTNRTETETAKKYILENVGGRYDDGIICSIGKKIVIYAANPEKIQSLVDIFIENYIIPDGIKGGICDVRAAEGDFESITVNGVEIGKFKFIRPHINSSYLTEVEMENAAAYVYGKTGYKMEIAHDSETEPCEYEIIVGDARRDGVESVTDRDSYSINVSGTKVYINGGSAHATAMGVSEFSKMLGGDVTDAASKTGSYDETIKSYDQSTSYRKTWGDDFDGTELDTSKWYQVNENSYSSPGLNGKKSLRSTDPRDVFVADGKFWICARQDEDYYYGGMIRTENKMTYKYGYLEMSALLPHGDGFWIALWACCNDKYSSLSPEEPAYILPEIDIVEMFGNSAYYAANCHSWPTTYGKDKLGLEHTSLDGKYSNDKKYTSPDDGVLLGNAFHTYGFLWDNTQMAFTCDGDLFFSYDTTTTAVDQECFNHSMYIIFSMALGFSSSPTAAITDNPTEWAETNKYVLDWINIYQKDDGLSEMNIISK